MEAVKHIIDSSLLDRIPLPQSLKNRRVEITIRAVEEDKGIEAASDEELFKVSDLLMEQNKEAYEVLAK